MKSKPVGFRARLIINERTQSTDDWKKQPGYSRALIRGVTRVLVRPTDQPLRRNRKSRVLAHPSQRKVQVLPEGFHQFSLDEWREAMFLENDTVIIATITARTLTSGHRADVKQATSAITTSNVATLANVSGSVDDTRRENWPSRAPEPTSRASHNYSGPTS
jgi:hypothetical protein